MQQENTNSVHSNILAQKLQASQTCIVCEYAQLIRPKFPPLQLKI